MRENKILSVEYLTQSDVPSPHKPFDSFYLLISQKRIKTTIFLWNILNNAFTQYIWEMNEKQLAFYKEQIAQVRQILKNIYKEITNDEKDYL